jgi:quercetin dioxygenase-like cupin family protein
MSARVQRGVVEHASAGEVEAELRAAGLVPRRWRNQPGDTYGWHVHDDHKVLVCVAGAIVFHVRGQGDVEVAAGDRLDLMPGTEHAATVGANGVECVEAYIP